jgi:thiol-disulfide isomerase/thioredoxin
MFSRSLVLVLLLTSLVIAEPVLEKLNNDQIRKLSSEQNILVMNFWATWCEPCVEEIPIFTKLQKSRKDITVIVISMDEPEKQELVLRFIQQHKMNYRVAIWTGDNFENMVNSIDPKWNGPIPATFIFQKGKLVYSKAGPITESELIKHLP